MWARCPILPSAPYNGLVQLRQALQSAIRQLEDARISEARLGAEVLAFHAFDCDRAFLFAHPEHEPTTDQLSRYTELVDRLAAGEPLQYLTGHQEFWKADFLVTPAVLIPRPETEHLVETALELARRVLACAPERHPTTHHLKLIDVGTGSGAIAISLARELPEAEVWAVDLSPEALEVACENTRRLGASVQFAESDVLAAIPRDASFDFVVSNPPYVGHNEADKVQEVVKRYEPQMAVFAGDEGLDIIRRLIPQSREALRPGGWLLIEIGYTQSERVMALLEGWDQVHSVADLAGIPRVIVARKPEQH